MYLSTATLLLALTNVLTFVGAAPLTSNLLTVRDVVGTNCDIVGNYTVVSGDTLGAIATTYNVTLAQIQYVNPSITNVNYITVGEVIEIPDHRCVTNSTTTPPTPTATCVSNSTVDTYKVVSGDTFYIISTEKLGITLQSFEDANKQVTDYSSITVGEVLNVPLCDDTCPP